MTEITLKRLRKDSYDDLMSSVLSKYSEQGKICANEDEWNNKLNEIMVDGNPIKIAIDMERLEAIVKQDMPTYEKNALIGMELHKTLKKEDGSNIPFNILLEKEVWAYLNVFIFKDLIRDLYMEKPSKNDEDRIKRYFFNCGTESKISRMGFIFLWLMVDKLQSEDDYNLNRVAFEFIDPVRAMFERKITRNSLVLRAFVQGIIENENDPKFKNALYKTRIPKHVNCFAAVNMIEAYDYDDMVKVIATEQRRAMN